MIIEYKIIICSWLLMIVALILFIPKNKFREANVLFLFKQVLTWPVGLLVVQFNLIQYPIHFLKKSTNASFTFDFFIYPALSVFFNLYYPEGKSILRKLFHYFIFVGGITVIEVLLEYYTNLIKYIHWTWYVSSITIAISLYISRRYYLWFYRLKAK